MFYRECKKEQSYIVAQRRALHRIPEIGTELPKTRDYVVQQLEAMGIPYRLNGSDCGVIAEIRGGHGGKTVALRADMDALPMQEETGAPYASQHQGCMHACGHDTHVAMLLGAAKVLQAHAGELHGTVRLLFQTAEENLLGAKNTIAAGGLEDVEAIFALHIGPVVTSETPAGTFVCAPGPCLAAPDRFVIDITGAGCHASNPERGIDPISIAAHICLGLQTLKAREFHPSVPIVIAVSHIEAGSMYNSIPTTAMMEGTVRSFDAETRQKAARRIAEIAEFTAKAYGGSAKCTMHWGPPPVINHADSTAVAQAAAKELVGEENVVTKLDLLSTCGEDFAYYQEQVPGTFIAIGSANPEKNTVLPLHCPTFEIDEDVLWKGSALLVNIAEKYLLPQP